MKTSVRLNTFETNSSSMHSFTVTNNQKTDPKRWEKHHIKDYTKDIVDRSINYINKTLKHLTPINIL